ncbi:MAG: HAMP domain-containing histidine kinase [Saprospiraceae bacterium]|nr:HAMP domain-containing histidine kinase [Saprospiraceae bacterium]
MPSLIKVDGKAPKTGRLRILSHVVVGYMLLAFLWWAILLLKKNDEAFAAKQTLLDTQTIEQVDLAQQELIKDHNRQKTMIIGEGLVFVIALFFGIWFINRGYTKEIEIIRQKKNFLLAITHELKSPLASIRLIFETFRRQNLETLDQQHLTSHGMKETERLSNLVKNLLLSARLEKSYAPVLEKHDIRTSIERVVGELRKSYPNVNILCETIDAPATIWMDEPGIHSMLTNLIENAIKYGQGQPIDISLYDKETHYEIRIADQGVGVPPAERSKIFEQFYRSGHEDTRQEKGTGIGLYIVAKITEMHGGRIRVVENKPKGSIFVATLPKAE